MNWVVIVSLIIIVTCTIKGYHHGLIRTVFSIFSVLLAIVLTIIIGPYVSKGIQGNEKIMNTISEQVEKTLGLDDKIIENTDLTDIINGLNLPKPLKEGLIKNNKPEMYEGLLVNNFVGYISNYLTVIILNAIAFIVVFLVIRITMAILIRILDIISRLPIINGLNKITGLLVGFLHGLIVLWIFCIFLTAISSTQIGKNIFVCINESKLLSGIYNHNLLLKVITDVAKILF